MHAPRFATSSACLQRVFSKKASARAKYTDYGGYGLNVGRIKLATPQCKWLLSPNESQGWQTKASMHVGYWQLGIRVEKGLRQSKCFKAAVFRQAIVAELQRPYMLRCIKSRDPHGKKNITSSDPHPKSILHSFQE